MTLEGAPHLKDEHLPVFDCANPCGRIGKRALSRRKPHPHDGGGAALHLGRHLQDHQHAQQRRRSRNAARAYMLSWKLGLKANALYRDGSKLSQPLASARSSPSTTTEEDETAGRAAAPRAQTVVTERIVERVIEKVRSQRTREACRIAARAIPRRPSSAATRSICAPANMKTAGSAKSSSTCTRKAPPSAA